MEFRRRRAWARLAGAAEPARLIAIAANGPDGLAEQDIGPLLDALTTRRSGRSARVSYASVGSK